MPGVLNESAPNPTRRTRRVFGRLIGFAAASLGVGAAAGVVWWLVVKPPGYELSSGGSATTSERGLSEFISGDAWFCAIGLVVGLLLGIAAWRWLRDLGWTVVLVVLVCATAARLGRRLRDPLGFVAHGLRRGLGGGLAALQGQPLPLRFLARRAVCGACGRARLLDLLPAGLLGALL